MGICTHWKVIGTETPTFCPHSIPIGGCGHREGRLDLLLANDLVKLAQLAVKLDKPVT